MKLRPYQDEAVTSLFRFFEDNQRGNPLVALPTGSGKSLVIAAFVAKAFAVYGPQAIVVLTHRKTLIEQDHKTLLRIWPLAPAGIYSAGLGKRETNQPITFAGIQSVFRRPADFGGVDLVIVDEAHLMSTKEKTMYRRFLTGLRAENPRLRVVGLTATPYRSDSGSLIEGAGALFTHICYDRTQRQAFTRLIDQGYLVPLLAKQTATEIDTSKVKMRGGDYIESELAKKILRDAPNIDHCVAETILEGVDRSRWLVFTVNIEHATVIAAKFAAAGVPTAVYHSEQESEENDRALEAFAAGEVQALVNVNCLTTGVDVPQIDLIAIMRPTRSVVLWVQMLGRGTRPAPGKLDCKVLDFGHCAETLGPINDPVLPNDKKTREDCPKCAEYRAFRDEHGHLLYATCPACGKSFSMPMKACPRCHYYSHASRYECESCGYAFPVQEKEIKKSAATTALVATGAAVVTEAAITFDVDRVEYRLHEAKNGVASLVVTYHHGVKTVERYVHFEHPQSSWPRILAHRFWMAYTKGTSLEGTDTPSMSRTALKESSLFRIPQAITTQRKGKFENVIGDHFRETRQEATHPAQVKATRDRDAERVDARARRIDVGAMRAY